MVGTVRSVGRASRFTDLPISNLRYRVSSHRTRSLEPQSGQREACLASSLINTLSPCRCSLSILSPSFTAMDRFSFAPHLTYNVRSQCTRDQRERTRWRGGRPTIVSLITQRNERHRGCPTDGAAHGTSVCVPRIAWGSFHLVWGNARYNAYEKKRMVPWLQRECA